MVRGTQTQRRWAVGGMVVLAVALAAPAFACTPMPTLSVDPCRPTRPDQVVVAEGCAAPPGAVLTVNGRNYRTNVNDFDTEGLPVQIRLENLTTQRLTPLGSAVLDTNGSFSRSVQIPTSLVPGAYNITVTQAGTGDKGMFGMTVTPAQPQTGEGTPTGGGTVSSDPSQAATGGNPPQADTAGDIPGSTQAGQPVEATPSSVVVAGPVAVGQKTTPASPAPSAAATPRSRSAAPLTAPATAQPVTAPAAVGVPAPVVAVPADQPAASPGRATVSSDLWGGFAAGPVQAPSLVGGGAGAQPGNSASLTAGLMLLGVGALALGGFAAVETRRRRAHAISGT